tara:strand:- start:254 stop:430 length:177 start_codon:yes stop_codon:yes gene_type:complete
MQAAMQVCSTVWCAVFLEHRRVVREQERAREMNVAQQIMATKMIGKEVRRKKEKKEKY